MRKRLGIILAIVGLTVLLTGSGVKAEGMGIGGTLGYISMNMGDLRDWYQVMKDFCDSAKWDSTLGSFQNNTLYGANGKFSFGENFMLRFGYSRLSGEQELEVTAPAPVRRKFSCQVLADAITGSLMLAMPLNSFNFYVGGGLGYYLAQYTGIYETLSDISLEKGKGSTIGYHGLLGTEIVLEKNSCLSLEALYRVAKVPYLKCTESNTSSCPVGGRIKRVVNYDTWELKDLELDFGGFSILGTLHIYF